MVQKVLILIMVAIVLSVKRHIRFTEEAIKIRRKYDR
jgi:hypothetical protein